MEDIIQEIINKATELKNNSKTNDYDIAEFVHIELGKVLYYDNNYTAKFINNKQETKFSTARKSNMLKADTNKAQKAQICKGMAELYAYILNEIGINARAIGTEKKGELRELSSDEAQHYCTIFKIGEQEYVQDYLIESALARIKVGEAELSKSMPGICSIDEYEHRSKIGFLEHPDRESGEIISEIKLSTEYLDNIYELNGNNLDIETVFRETFNELNKHLQNKEMNFGFEEAKDFVMITIVNLMKKSGLTPEEIKNKMKKNVKIINLVKESETECGVACIYEIEGKKYLVRGQDETTDIKIPAGEISDGDLADILEQGYEGRNQNDREKLNIQIELAKWSDEKFLEDTRIELCEYVNDLDKIFCERYKNLIVGQEKSKVREEMLETLKIRGLFDDNMNYIGSSNIVKFDREKKVANGGYMKGSIIVNPNSAKQFYDAYMDFSDGKLEGIREDVDYSKLLVELNDLSSLEILYWHYANQRTYQDFLKSTMLHENVHRWTLNGDGAFLDDPIDIYVMEGYVEREARDIAEENNIEYARSFRNDEINFIDYLGRNNDKTDNISSMLYYADSSNCLMFAIKIEILRKIRGISVKKAEDLALGLHKELNKQVENATTNSIGKNYREVFASIKPDKSYQLIGLIEALIKREQIRNGQIDKKHGLDEFHDVAIKNRSESTNEATRETTQGVKTEGELEQDNNKKLEEI